MTVHNISVGTNFANVFTVNKDHINSAKTKAMIHNKRNK